MKRIERALETGPSFGVRPVPRDARRLSGLDLAVLWGDLSVGLLVLAAGALLVPALSLPRALAAIVIGSVIGSIPLALVGVAGAREGVPGMVLFRPVLGVRGSWAPSVLNLVQLIGWTALEFWAMGRVANEVSKDLLGLDSYPLWLAVVAVVCTALALGGPVVVVRKWLERFGVYVLAAIGVWLTYKVLSAADLDTLWKEPGTGGWPSFALAVDLVIAMPISWLPLVADYNRLARGRSFGGTLWGYAAGNAWFFALGALLVVVASATPDAAGIGSAVTTLAGGTLLLVILLVGETDEAFADIYSSAVSAQNLFPRARQRRLIVGISALGLVLAAFLSMGAYQNFLLLIGSVFVPLFGVFIADYFVLRNAGYGEDDLFERGGRFWFRGGVNWVAIVPWALGFLLYQWSVPTELAWWKGALEQVIHGWLHLPFPLFNSVLGASLPSFLGAFVAAVVLGRARSRRPGERPQAVS